MELHLLQIGLPPLSVLQCDTTARINVRHTYISAKEGVTHVVITRRIGLSINKISKVLWCSDSASLIHSMACPQSVSRQIGRGRSFIVLHTRLRISTNSNCQKSCLLTGNWKVLGLDQPGPWGSRPIQRETINQFLLEVGFQQIQILTTVIFWSYQAT